MCGIAGFCNFNGQAADQQLLEKMTHSIASRGPDGHGTFTREGVGLGHRRLSIIDLAGGYQPMFNEDDSIAVVFNGEIYNFLELRNSLQAKGHTFKSDHSDTEVIVHAWEEWGEDCVLKFRGMFAFCIVDWNKQCLFLARDHLGIKPLVYEINNERISFASELQALKKDPRFDRSIRVRSLDEYLLLQYIPAPNTIYEKAKKLAPAHRLLISFKGETNGPERYWDVAFKPEEGRSLGEWKERLDAALQESVQKHLVSDVPFGAFLSGGMDSTAVVGVMSRLLDQPVKAFSIGFGESDFDETHYAKLAADRFGVEHLIEQVQPKALDILPDMVKHYGEPFGDSSAIPTYYVCKMARAHVPMVLSGDGGDEAMAGYASYYGWALANKAREFKRPFPKNIIRNILSGVNPAAYPPDPIYRDLTYERWLAQINYCWRKIREDLWKDDYAHIIDDRIDQIHDPFMAYKDKLHPIQLAQYIDYQTYLPNDILTKVDVASMMHGLEVRTPLIDRGFLDEVLKIPATTNFKLAKDGKSFDGKRVLKAWLRDYFPNDFIDRKKMGFSIPLKEWFDVSGELRGALEERLLDTSSPLCNYFKPEALSKLVENHNVKYDHSAQLWLLFFLAEWLEQN